MEILRTQRSLFTFAAKLCATAISVGTGLVVTPLLLKWLGTDRFGGYRAILQWLGYLALLDLSMSSALMTALGRALGRDDQTTARSILRVGIKYYCVITIASLACGGLLTALIEHLVRIGPSFTSELRAAMLVGLVGVTLLPISVFKILADASQRGYVIHMFFAVQAVLSAAIALFTARNGWGIPGQVLATTVGTLPLSLFLAWDGLRRHPNLLRKSANEKLEKPVRQELLAHNKAFIITHIAGLASFHSDAVILGYLTTGGTITAFVLTQTLIQLVNGQLMSIGNSTWAALAQLHSQGELKRFQARVLEISKIIVMLGSAAFIPIVAYNERFMQLWLKSGYYGGHALTITASLAVLFHALDAFWGWTFTSASCPQKIVPIQVSQAVVNICASIAFTRLFGVSGPVAGSVAAFFVVSAWAYPRAMRKSFRLSPLALARVVVAPLVPALPIGYASWVIARSHHTTGWTGLVGEMSVTGLAYLAACWFFVLDHNERGLWKHYLQMIRPWKRKNYASA